MQSQDYVLHFLRIGSGIHLPAGEGSDTVVQGEGSWFSGAHKALTRRQDEDGGWISRLLAKTPLGVVGSLAR